MISIDLNKQQQQCDGLIRRRLVDLRRRYAGHPKVHRIYEIQVSALNMIEHDPQVGSVVVGTLEFMIDQRALHRGAQYFEEAVASQLLCLSRHLTAPEPSDVEEGPF